MASLAEDDRVNVREAFPNKQFRALWAAVGVSQLGSAVTIMVLPLIAVVTLGATAGQMAWLTALELAPALLIRLPASAWADSLKRPRVPFMVACYLVQACIIGAVPLLWWFGLLTFGTLLPLAALASAALGVYSSLSSPILVQVVPKPNLVDANAKISATRSAADIAGPAVASGLLAVLAAPLVVLVDAFSFLLAAALYTRVKPKPVPVAPPAAKAFDAPGMWRLARAMMRRSPVQAMVSVAFVNGAVQTVLVLFMTRELKFAPSIISLLLGLGAVGGVVAGLLTGRVLNRVGPGRTLAIGAVATICSLALLPFSTTGFTAVAGVVLFELAGSLGGTLMIATVFGGLQASAPEGKVSQTMAIAGLLLQLAALIGAPLGGILGSFSGLRVAMLTALVLMAVTLLPQVARWAAARWSV